jgi:glycosyltransferase involved in cell wall biosynthesis
MSERTRNRDPVISVVIPAYNRERTIGRAIQSALAQSRPPAEIIVVDDGSTDGTGDVIAAHGDQVRHVRQPNAGAAAARNRGVEEATAPWVAFLDSDDQWFDDHLETMAAAIAATDGAAGFYFADTQRPLAEGGGSLWDLGGFAVDDGHVLVDDATDWVMMALQPTMVQSSVFDRDRYLAVGGMWDALRIREDTHLYFVMGIGGSACAVAGGGVQLGGDESGGGRLTVDLGPDTRDWWVLTRRLYADVVSRFPAVAPHHRRELRSRLAAADVSLAQDDWRSGRGALPAARHLVRGVCVAPAHLTARAVRKAGRTVRGSGSVAATTDAPSVERLGGSTRRPRVTIGVPVWNGADHLEDCLDSLLAQTYDDIEILISDNASTDRTQEICLAYCERDPRVVYHRQRRNIGASANYNYLVHQARGELFRWAAHDDLCAPAFVEKCVAALDASPSDVLAFTGTTFIDADGAVLGKHDTPMCWRNAPTATGRLRDLLVGDLVLGDYRATLLLKCLPQYGVMRTSALLQTQLMGNYGSSDMVLLVDLALLGGFAEVDEYLFFFRVHEGSSREANETVEELAQWYDPSQGDRYPMPWTMVLNGFVRGVVRSSVRPSEKAISLALVGRWFLAHRRWRIIGGELKRRARQRWSSLPLATSKTRQDDGAQAPAAGSHLG